LTFLIISTTSIQAQAVLFSGKRIREVSQGMWRRVDLREKGRPEKMSVAWSCMVSVPPPNRTSLKLPLLRLVASRGDQQGDAKGGVLSVLHHVGLVEV
jgi:hypothetical protein